jgi:hypothetical protein
MAEQYEMRVGDAERESTVAELREHFANGRLTQEEFNERVDQTFAAKTRGDLKTVLRDLPSVRPLVTAAAGSSGSGSGAGSRTNAGSGRAFGMFQLALASVWVLTLLVGALDLRFGFFPGRPFGIVLIIGAFAVLRRILFGRRRGRCGGPRRRW